MTIQKVMKIGWLALALAGVWGMGSGSWQPVSAGAVLQQSAQSGQGREFHQTYDLAPNGTIGIYNNSGAIRISSWNENRVKVDAVKRGRRAEDFEQVRIEVTARPERVEIRVLYPSDFNWRSGGVSVDFDIKLPRTAAVSPANATSGDIAVTGPIGRVIARSTSGNISAQDVTETANLNTTSGNVTATRVGGELRAGATSGTVTITNANSRVFAQASSGSIRVTGARDDVTATLSSGDVRLEKIGGRATVRSSSGPVVINDVGGDVQATSTSDNVTVTNVRGRATVTAISGNLTLRNIAEGARATAHSGSITVSDSKGRIEANTTSDSITLINLDSAEVVAKTVSGSVQYTGNIQDGGRYEFESFNGEVVLILPPDSNFNLTARTHNGSVNTEFPLRLNRAGGGGAMFGTVGTGGTEITVSSFNGSVRIRKSVR